MNFINVKNLYKFKYLLLILVIVLGYLLRSHDLYTWPRTGATFDEYAWTWQGMNLIQSGAPISWSPHPQYKNAKDVFYNKVHFRLVTPYLEHPPLFGLVAGSYAIFNGVHNMSDLTVNHVRGLSLILGILSIFIIYLFASEIYGYKIGLLSAFIYSIVPTIAVGSRIVQNENFFIPFFLLSLFLISKFVKTKKTIFRNIAAVICGLLILAKVPWVAASFAAFFILLFLKKYKDIYKFLMIVISISLLYLVYGAYYNWDLFINLWQFQLNRYDMAFNSVFALFTSPYLVDRFLIDGWIYFGWVAMFILFTKDLKKNYFVVFPFLAYFLMFVFAIPNEPGHGWYRYPFYPFLIISIALFLKDYFVKDYLLTFIYLIVTSLSMFQLSFAQSFGFSYSILRIFIFTTSLTLLPIFFPRAKKTSNIIAFSMLILILFLTNWTILNYNEQ